MCVWLTFYASDVFYKEKKGLHKLNGKKGNPHVFPHLPEQQQKKRIYGGVDVKKGFASSHTLNLNSNRIKSALWKKDESYASQERTKFPLAGDCLSGYRGHRKIPELRDRQEMLKKERICLGSLDQTRFAKLDRLQTIMLYPEQFFCNYFMQGFRPIARKRQTETGVQIQMVLMVKDGEGEPILFISKKGGIVQALSTRNKWNGYSMDYQGKNKLVFSLTDPKLCTAQGAPIRIHIEPKRHCKNWDFEIGGSFADRDCTIVDCTRKIVAQ
ncbi:hypothetical protein ACJX0J_012001, partial [Zea mays]